MIRQKKKHIIVAFVVCIVLVLLMFFVVFRLVYITPNSNGSYSIKDYESQIIQFGSDNKYESVENYRDAYSIAKKEISARFPSGIFHKTRFDFSAPSENRCDVYYDEQSDTWLVYAYPKALNDDIVIFGGAYYCIVSSDGTVLACWGAG